MVFKLKKFIEIMYEKMIFRGFILVGRVNLDVIDNMGKVSSKSLKTKGLNMKKLNSSFYVNQNQ